MTKCKRCGRCCYVLNPRTKVWIPCKYLRGLKNGKTKCQVYEYRLGKLINFNWKCKENSPWNIPGCPFNTKDKKPHPFWTGQERL